jgi:hypothetical protein
MRKLTQIIAAASAAICLCLMAAMAIVAAWTVTVSAEQILPPPIDPLKLMEQAQHLHVQQTTDFSMIY